MSEGNASASAAAALVSEGNASTSEGNASASAAAALVSEGNASTSAAAALVSEGNAASIVGSGNGEFIIPITTTDTAPSTNTATGALIIAGGAGVGGALNIGGPFRSSKPCAAGYSRVGPNLCMRTSVPSFTPITTPGQSIPRPEPGIRAFIINTQLTTVAANAFGNRTASVIYYFDFTLTTAMDRMDIQTREQVAVVSGAWLSKQSRTMILRTDLIWASTSGTPGYIVEYAIMGYFD